MTWSKPSTEGWSSKGFGFSARPGAPGETGAAPILRTWRTRPSRTGGWPMKRPTDKYNDPGPRTARTLLVRGGLLLVTAAVVGSLAGWTKRVRATNDVIRAPDVTVIVARRIGGLADQLAAANGERHPGQLDQVSDPVGSGGVDLRRRAERRHRSGAGLSAGQDREPVPRECPELDGRGGVHPGAGGHRPVLPARRDGAG